MRDNALRRKPRCWGVLTDVHLDDDVAVRVVDSTADLRYLVVPRQPRGSEGMPVAQLAELVTRDSMIGVGEAKAPA